jgi:sulfur carrier protein ThiS
MLTITVNGTEEKLNIGCRTYVALDELLRLLSADGSLVSLNGDAIATQFVPKTMVKAGDSITCKLS